jgi:hypothetical protein
MKKYIFAILPALAGLLSGCIVLSVYPYYTDKDLVFEPLLSGEWHDPSKPKETWLFAREGEDAWRIRFGDGEKTYPMTGHLFKLRGQLFLDLFPEEGAECPVMPPPIPSHLLLRVSVDSTTLRMTPLDFTWLRDLLEKKPNALRHHLAPRKTDSDERFFVLTADTRELQAFVIKHLKTEAAWGEVIELKRGPASAAGESGKHKSE